jgi:hypothetical protein
MLLLPSRHGDCLVTCLSLSSLSLAQNFIVLSPAIKAKDASVSVPLDGSFAGFGIEPSNLFSFTGGVEPNQFSINLLQNLANYSGTPPHIRLGGNTGDYMIYDSSFADFNIKGNSQSVGQGAIASDSMIIGPGYFKALDRLPKDTPITYGLNLAYQESDYLDNIATEAKAALDGMRNVKLYSFEIGNEPDLYLQNGFRAGIWDGKTYTEHFLERAKAVYERVIEPAGLPSEFFEPMASASTIGTTFEIDMLVTHGIMDPVDGVNYVAVWNQHDYFYFIGVTGYPLTLEDLMLLDKTNAQFKYWETQVRVGLSTGLPYVLREMCSVGPVGIHGISDTFGAALWTLNFFLYAATLNISSVQMHMTDNSYASAWQPISMNEKPPSVRPLYYAHVAMAQLLGNGNGTTQISLLDTTAPSTHNGYIRAYAAYAKGNLQSLVLINAKPSNASVQNKPSFTFTLSLPPETYATKELHVSYLTAPGTDSLYNTTFNGLSFSDIDGTPQIQDPAKHILEISDAGAVSITVRDSQAVVVNLEYKLGSLPVPEIQEPRPSRSTPVRPTSPVGPHNVPDGDGHRGGNGHGRKNSAGPGWSRARTAAETAVMTSLATVAATFGGGRGQRQAGQREQRGVAGPPGTWFGGPLVWGVLVLFGVVVLVGLGIALVR